MKKLIFILTITLSFKATLANAQFNSQLVHELNKEIEVELNNTTVLCSRADYDAEFLKILIPQLAEFTLLDHRNLGAGAPCVGAGSCWVDGKGPGAIIDPSQPTELITVNVKLFRNTSIENNECFVSLHEKIETSVRGITFFHSRNLPLGQRHLDDCV